MEPVPTELIQKAILIMGRSGVTQDEIESEVLAIAHDPMLARRLIDWIVEAFGMVLAAHVTPGMIMPTTFSARSSNGKWLSLKLTAEPIFFETVKIAQAIYHNGPRELFGSIAVRSSMIQAINNALNSGANLKGAVFSGPALLGIPAEVYPSPPKSIWTRFFEWRLSRRRKSKTK